MEVRTKNSNAVDVNKEKVGRAIKTPFWIVNKSAISRRNIPGPERLKREGNTTNEWRKTDEHWKKCTCETHG